MKELKIVTIFPDDVYFSWHCHLWLESLREINLSDKAIVLIFTPQGRQQNIKSYQPIMDLYPEAEFNFYEDKHDVSQLLGMYIPILRPYTAWRYWLDHPEMKEKAVFYCDSDILFMPTFSLEKYIDDDINYLSDTNSYINASYFDSKINDVLPYKLDEYKTIDVLNEAASIVGITRQVCEANNNDSGGAQYLLKNIDADFWKDVMNQCIPLIQYLGGINKRFFESEDKGLQKWCSDMWLIIWNLWKRDRVTSVVKDLDFAWATDNIERLNDVMIFHNAGVTSTFHGDVPFFYKGKYHMGTDPTLDPHLDVVLGNEKSQKLCTWMYAKKIKDLKEKYNLKY